MLRSFLVLFTLTAHLELVTAQISIPTGYLLHSISSTNSPIGMSFDANDKLLVANVQSPPRKITSFTLINGLYSSDSIVVNFNGNDHRPEFIALDGADNIYFARPDNNDGNLYRLTSNSTIENVYLANIGDLDDPRGMVFNDQGDLFVANNAYPNQDSYVSKFSFNTAHQLISQNLQFISGITSLVQDLTFAPNGDLFIAGGSSIARVQFDNNGNLQSVDQNFILFPSTPSSRLVGIAVDIDGDMFVSQMNTASADSGKIFSFDTLGNYSVFASGFNQPRKLIFDSDNRLYVADYAENMIYMIECDNTYRALEDRFCDAPLSVKEFESRANSLSVYPNPSNGQFDILLDESTVIDEVLVMNALGEVVEVSNVSVARSIHVDISDQSSGVYFVVGSDLGEVVTRSTLIIH